MPLYPIQYEFIDIIGLFLMHKVAGTLNYTDFKTAGKSAFRHNAWKISQSMHPSSLPVNANVGTGTGYAFAALRAGVNGSCLDSKPRGNRQARLAARRAVSAFR